MKIGRDGKIALGLIAFCLLNYFYLLPTQVIQQGSSPTYPLIINTLLLVSSVGYFFQSIFQKTTKDANIQKDKKSIKTRIPKPMLKAITETIFIIVWVTVLDYVGFLLSSMVFLTASIILYGSRNYFKISTISILFPLAIYFLFKVILKTTLPEGILESILDKIIFSKIFGVL